MADITMCDGTDCPLKETCYRFKAKPDEYRQAFFVEVPIDHTNMECKYYWRD